MKRLVPRGASLFCIKGFLLLAICHLRSHVSEACKDSETFLFSLGVVIPPVPINRGLERNCHPACTDYSGSELKASRRINNHVPFLDQDGWP